MGDFAMLQNCKIFILHHVPAFNRKSKLQEDLHTSYEYGYTGNKDDNTTLTLIENINNLSAIINNNFYINNIDAIQQQINTREVFYNDTASGTAHRGKSITSVIYKK
jgi:hypothetical protein